ncbi:tetratricopeptide repeat protein [uncultured Roseibium sp.]|uniref:tetratricopeptide repeat protein n=1 Tax=uncultured Roseibium sp. TaxID=1936171 RepID=UPI003217CA6B
MIDHLSKLDREEFQRTYSAALALRGESEDQFSKAADRLEDAVEALEEVPEEDASAQTIQDALEALRQGKPSLAEGIFRQIQNDRAQEGENALFEASEAARHRAALLYLNDKAKALIALQEAVQLCPENMAAQYDLGDVAISAGNLSVAYDAFKNFGDLGAKKQSQREIMIAHARLGDILVAQGQLGDALERYEAGLEVAKRLAASDASNSRRQRDLSVSFDRIGGVLVAQGKLGEALERYEAGLAVAERLAGSDPSNSEWQRDLIVSCVKVSEAAPVRAKFLLERALEIAERLETESHLAPRDDWMIKELHRRLDELE